MSDQPILEPGNPEHVMTLIASALMQARVLFMTGGTRGELQQCVGGLYAALGMWLGLRPVATKDPETGEIHHPGTH